jgi:hypothetical protein
LFTQRQPKLPEKMESQDVNCFVRLPDGRRCPFFIQPHCKLQKLKDNTFKQLGFDIQKVVLECDTQLLGDNEKYLIEDYGIKNGDCLALFGKKVNTQEEKITDAVYLLSILQWNGAERSTDVQVKTQVRKTSTLDKVVQLFQHNCDFIPSSVQLFTEDNKLLNLSSTVEQAGLKDGSTMYVRGDYFSNQFIF